MATAGRPHHASQLTEPVQQGAHRVGLVVQIDHDQCGGGGSCELVAGRGDVDGGSPISSPAASALTGPDPQLSAAVVLLDVDLPGLDGLAVLRLLATAGRLDDTRVIMLTSRTGEADTLEALRLGAFDHIGKPFSVPILLERIERALRAG
jgi:CheY-like chemotaxis protein